MRAWQTTMLNCDTQRAQSHPFHETIHHALFAGRVELHRQLIAVDRGDVAVAEFLMEDAVAGCAGKP